MKIVVVVVVCIIGVAVLAQQSPRVRSPRQDHLFTVVSSPAPEGVPFPSDAAFITINTAIFDEIAGGSRNIDRIEDFPMPDGTTATLAVEEFSVFMQSSRIVAGTASGDRDVPLPPHILLRGTIEGDGASHVYLAVFRDHALGYIEQPGEDRILITPALKSAAEGLPMPQIVYRQYDVDPGFRATTWNCETEELPANQKALDRIALDIARYRQMQQPQATQVRNLAIAVECDNDFFKDFETFADAQQYAIEILGAMSDIYMRDANCAIKASFLRIWQTDDPYTGATTSELLPQFQEYWNDNMSAERATALLFSGDNNLGGGLAYLDVLCMNDGRGYAVCGLYSNFTYPNDKYIWDNDVTSHEFGHNVGSPHTHNCSWAPPVDSCVASEGGCYPTPKPRKGTIMSYCHLTPSGTELKLHTRVATFMKNKFAESGCAPFVQIPEAKASADKLICKEGSAELTGVASKGTPPYQTLWFAANATKPSYGLDTMTLLTVHASPNMTMPYVFRVTDANNVRSYDTVIVAVDTVKVEAGANSYIVCGLDSVTMTPVSFSGRGKVTFEWRENASDKLVATGQTVRLPARDTMMYKVIATDSIGCTGYDQVTIIPVPPIEAAITPSPSNFCDGVAETLDAGSGFATYQWSTGATTRSITVTQSGTYSCIVTLNGIGCADTAIITVTKNPSPEKPKITFENNTLKCPVTADSFQWYKQTSPTAIATRVSNSNTPELSPQVNGYYHVRIFNEFGCDKRSDTLLVVLTGGVSDEEPASTVRVFPNPAKQNVTIDAGTGPALSNLYITDIGGKTLWSSPRMSDQMKTIEIGKWSSGGYVLHYTAAGKELTLKFVKE